MRSTPIQGYGKHTAKLECSIGRKLRQPRPTSCPQDKHSMTQSQPSSARCRGGVIEIKANNRKKAPCLRNYLGFFITLPNKKISEDLSRLALGFFDTTVLNSARNLCNNSLYPVPLKHLTSKAPLGFMCICANSMAKSTICSMRAASAIATPDRFGAMSDSTRST